MELTTAQKNALLLIEQKQFLLLHGVTGSGKTEVYLQAAAKTISRGEKVIVLVPEISLTPQTVERFSARFKTAVLHSRLTPKEKRESWQKIVNNEVDVAIGPRSAVFAPFSRIGLIIIDEEHDPSYKQDNNPRYHAVEVASKRAELTGAKLILGSATPSLETFYKFTSKPESNCGYIKLPQRVLNRPLPQVTLIDLRQELAAGNFSLLSRKLREEIAARLSRREKTMLFLNRRGFSTFVSCRSCGYVLECSRCKVALTYHQDNSARCHYCDKKVEVPSNCPHCGSKYFKYFGAGTQKVEAELKKYFGQAKVLRMDKDTVQKRNAHQDILNEFHLGDADILIGTQMIAKGHDFPEVTLVGIISADTTLHLPDFRATERTFQLLAQVAGRTGRGEKGGTVIIQTYSPENFAIQAAVNHDYHAFCQQELTYRQEVGYPPFSSLTLVEVASPEEAKAKEKIKEFAERFKPTNVFGPMPSPIPKLRGFYRWQILLKDQNIDYKDFAQSEDVKIEIDVDPVNMY
jgi:primosomal protein N' (replication factor Y)